MSPVLRFPPARVPPCRVSYSGPPVNVYRPPECRRRPVECTLVEDDRGSAPLSTLSWILQRLLLRSNRSRNGAYRTWRMRPECPSFSWPASSKPGFATPYLRTNFCSLMRNVYSVDLGNRIFYRPLQDTHYPATNKYDSIHAKHTSLSFIS
jgi:hypothetical protein